MSDFARYSVQVVPGPMDINKVKEIARYNDAELNKPEDERVLWAVSYYEDGDPNVCAVSILIDIGGDSVYATHEGVTPQGIAYKGMILGFSSYGTSWACEELVNPGRYRVPYHAYLDQGRGFGWPNIEFGKYDLGFILKKIGKTCWEISQKVFSAHNIEDRIRIVYRELWQPFKDWLAVNDEEEFVKWENDGGTEDKLLASVVKFF